MKCFRPVLAALLILIGLSTSAVADVWEDCKQSDADKAIAACTQIISKGPESDKQLAVAHTYRAIANRKKGEHDKAIADYNKAIEINPSYIYAYFSRALYYTSKGEQDKAIADYTKLLEIDPKYVDAYVNRGVAHRSKGEHNKAIADHTKAIEIDPKGASAYYARGLDYVSKGEHDNAINDFTKAVEIDPKLAFAYYERGNAYRSKGELDKAIADYSKAMQLDPKYSAAYLNRGVLYRSKGEHDKAIADHTKVIEINPKNPANGHYARGLDYVSKGEHDKAFADFNKAIEIDPKHPFAYSERGNAYRNRGEFDKAIADYTKAIEINPKYVLPYDNRGIVYENQKNYALALADFTKAIEIGPDYALAYLNRGKVYETQGGKRDAAIADYQKILALPATSATDRQRQDTARERIDKLTRAASTSMGAKRVALVVGNSDYAHAGILPNPVNDARAVAAALRRLGFAVTDYYDLTRDKMGRALKDFGDRVEGAEWAVVFFAGHGLEINGTPYLIPIDAELKRDSHVVDEALSLSQVQAKLDAASKLGLVILDACRNNPFVSRMVRTGGAPRSIGRGLSLIEPEGNVMVAYAAKHGTTAEDGSGKHSPFTEALLANIEEPGLEINFLFRKVRDQVREKTAKKQEPFLYGSLGSEQLYFKAAATR